MKKALLVLASVAMLAGGVTSAHASTSAHAMKATALSAAAPAMAVPSDVQQSKGLSATKRHALKPVSARKAAQLNKIMAASTGKAKTASGAASLVYQGFYSLASPFYFYQYYNYYYSGGYYWIDYYRYFLDCSDYGASGCVWTHTYHLYRYVYYSGYWHYYHAYGPYTF
jgi:hypothetical protein